MDVPEIAALGKKGHTLDVLQQECDIVMGKKGWFFDVRYHIKELGQAVADGWARVYPKKEGK
jgi:hypothetical protein